MNPLWASRKYGQRSRHHRSVRKDVPPARHLQDDQLRQCVRQRAGARLPLDQLKCLCGQEPRHRIELDPSLDRAEERDGCATGLLPRHAGAVHRYALVELLEVLVRPTCQFSVGPTRRKRQLAAVHQRFNQRVEPAQRRHVSGRRRSYLQRAAKFLAAGHLGRASERQDGGHPRDSGN